LKNAFQSEKSPLCVVGAIDLEGKGARFLLERTLYFSQSVRTPLLPHEDMRAQHLQAPYRVLTQYKKSLGKYGAVIPG